MEFCMCLVPAPWPALLPSGTHLTLNGMGGVTTIFLCSTRNGAGCGTGLLQNNNWHPPLHKFTHYVVGNQAYNELPERDDLFKFFRYLLEVYVDDFVSLVIPTSREQLRHVSTGTMMGIHDIFLADDNITKPNMEMCKQYCQCLVLIFTFVT